MLNLSPIGSIGGQKTSGMGAASLLKKDKKTENENSSVAYMGPSIGNLLNGSQQPSSTASAVRA